MHSRSAKAHLLAKQSMPNLASQMRAGVRQHGLEHWLQLAGRARDDAQHLRGRGLLLQRLGKLARALLHLVEQPHVLDRDHRLVGERPHQLDLTIRERAGRPAGNRDDANGTALVYHRHGNDGSQLNPTIGLTDRRFQLLGVDVRNVDDRGIDERARRHRRLTARNLWEELPRRVSRAGPWIVLPNEVKEFAVVTRHDGVLAAA